MLTICPQIHSLTSVSAPFTEEDNLSFEFLEKLMENCQNNKPDVLILTGAFLPIKSENIFDVAMELDDYFLKMLSRITEKVGVHTMVVIVTSVDDINSSACYPTRPYSLKKLRPFPNLFMAPDPSIIEINGITIGLTSIDITQQLADAEFCVNAGPNRNRRYVDYLFHQKSFYPLFPPKMPTDIRLLHEYGTINKVPNILVVPSDMKYYMRDFNNCFCINPGRLSNEGSAGTFARVIVRAPKESETEVKEWICGQIVNI